MKGKLGMENEGFEHTSRRGLNLDGLKAEFQGSLCIYCKILFSVKVCVNGTI